ncbi:MAG: Crp/Fnr family transcriptional regulator [Gammaproteobacteria bacterium]|nr:Crp/Fnr family transcriptional regulator [Gammaproteobacteria bacterium]
MRNGVLAGLLAADYKDVLPKLEHVTLTRGRTLYHADQEIADVYFPEDAVVAMIDTMEDGRTVEVGLIGREGIVGINVFLGGVITPDKAVVQLSGGAMRMSSDELRAQTRHGSPLQLLLLRYALTFLAVISQSVACSQHHDIEQRLARLLLTLHHYAGSQEFSMMQAGLAGLLGVRRSGITGAAGELRAQGLIRYQRGRIRVLDRRGLEKTSCECYRFIGRQYAHRQRMLPRLPSRR